MSIFRKQTLHSRKKGDVNDLISQELQLIQFDIQAGILKMSNLYNFKIENIEVNGINLSYLNYLKTVPH